jgi:mono/diheme cytochrome c family protein
MRSNVKGGLGVIALLVIVSLTAAFSPRSPEEKANHPETREERIAQGERIYHVFCAGCHGKTAKGDGAMADLLKLPPADLTRINARNGGTFPAERVAETIDGRAVVRGHGAQMPVWGWSFKEPGRDWDQEREVQERVRDLVLYLESIQAK